jgi:hypothetical protein
VLEDCRGRTENGIERATAERGENERTKECKSGKERIWYYYEDDQPEPALAGAGSVLQSQLSVEFALALPRQCPLPRVCDHDPRLCKDPDIMMRTRCTLGDQRLSLLSSPFLCFRIAHEALLVTSLYPSCLGHARPCNPLPALRSTRVHLPRSAAEDFYDRNFVTIG